MQLWVGGDHVPATGTLAVAMGEQGDMLKSSLRQEWWAPFLRLSRSSPMALRRTAHQPGAGTPQRRPEPQLWLRDTAGWGKGEECGLKGPTSWLGLGKAGDGTHQCVKQGPTSLMSKEDRSLKRRAHPWARQGGGRGRRPAGGGSSHLTDFVPSNPKPLHPEREKSCVCVCVLKFSY